ncbi:MAG: SDR family NAD(P)-dependent oxidoreductase [Deltaproteobacteria bacterium]|nr:SDR family NAD(P)-dependent oxidoreductase [Deltaproteobacteria bacterium]
MSPAAIITGASTGIGRDLSLVLAREGYDLGLTARREDLLLALKDEISGRYPDGKVFVAPADTTNESDLEAAMKDLIGKLGRLDLMIANAGIGYPTPAWKNNWPDIKKILEVNVMGAIHSLELAKEAMLKQGAGHLVGISSVAGFRGLPASSGYCTSKSALTTYLESIRIDLKPLGIAVTSIHPGYIATPMTKKNPYMPFLLSPETAARKISRAIRRKKARYLFPWQIALLVRIMRVIPDSVFDWVMSLKKQKGVFKD